MNEFKITWGLFSDTAKAPTKKYEDAGYDIYEDELTSKGVMSYVLQPSETRRFDTNIGYVIPAGYVAIVKERSSYGKISTYIGAGVCDSGYRNQVGVYITNASDESIVLDLRKAIAQIIFIKHESDENAKSIRTTTEEFSKIFQSKRGLGREGSTNK